VFVTGTPQFDFHFQPEYHWTREAFCARVGADPNRPIVLYSTAMANHVVGEPLIVEHIADMLKEMPDLGSPQLLVREYAKGPQGHYDDLKRRRPDILFSPMLWERNWLTPLPEDIHLFTNTLRHCDVGINVASTISLELCMFDKPVINVSYLPEGVNAVFDYRRYYDFEHYRPVVESGGVKLAHSEAEMAVRIREALEHPAADSAQRAALLRQMFGDRLDGRSGARVAEQLVQLACRAR
jgi:hypothetical protein